VVISVAVTISALAGVGVGYNVGYKVGRQHNSDYLNSVRIASLNDRLTALRVMRENKLPGRTVESMELSALVYLDSIALDAPGPNSAYLLQHAAQRLSAYAQDFPDSVLADPKQLKVVQVRNLVPK
jgi:hypothetical protein